MADKKNNKLRTIYEKLLDKLFFISINEQTINLFKSNNDFQNIVINNLSLLKAIELKLKIKDEKSNELIQNFKTILAKEIEIKKTQVSDIDDLEDSINYIDIFLTNTLNSDIVDKMNKVNKTKNLPENEVLETKIVDGEEVYNFNNENKDKHFNADDYLKKNHFSAEMMADSLIMQQASMLVRKDILENKLYKFDSKPKIVIWLKILNYVLLSIFGIAIILYYVLSSVSPLFLTNEFIFTGKQLSLMSIFCLILLSLFIIITLYSEIKLFKNDNYKFSVKLSFVFFITLIFTFFIIDAAKFLREYDNAKNVINETIEINNKDYYTNTKEGYYYVTILFPINIICIVTFALIILNSIVLIIIRPRIDINKINEATAKYAEAIKNGTIKQSDLDSVSGNGFRTISDYFF